MKDDILTIREVADYLKLTEKIAYKLVAEGKLPGFKVGGSWRFKRNVIDAWIKKQTLKGDDDVAGDAARKKFKPIL